MTASTNLSTMFGMANGGVELMNGTATTGETTIAVATTQVTGASRLTAGFTRAIPIAGSTAVLLPMNQSLNSPIVVNNSAATAVTLLVFPPWNDTTSAASGGKIQNGSANASFSVAQNKTAIFYPHPNGVDYSAVLSA
jgi:hypothetical protein